MQDAGCRPRWRKSTCYTVREPITPFNFPMNLVAHKVFPAIAASPQMMLKEPSIGLRRRNKMEPRLQQVE
ncbi:MULTISPECIES: aldehyde dehydrogenase family protein [unclassified Peribacillus]|uniref:aldehyde dehydrogenase family protein n=1 Tax=unclassified Peribacillus TaxID=2675266 RepID=UPI00366AEAB2